MFFWKIQLQVSDAFTKTRSAAVVLTEELQLELELDKFILQG